MESKYPKIFKWLGIIEIIAGFFVAGIMADQARDDGFAVFIPVFLIGIVTGIFLMAFGHVISLLEEISNNSRRSEENSRKTWLEIEKLREDK
ncbi:hypothetical protein [Gracilibacillus sp. YIM 98692]|uniref:hypothetical protein n=1 Tax=Gracilibacillus sp. YIM 98692 TaxID=2663532 RepID=UPI0013D4C331|nr:hypothetical protein [Gracilibacillus sp. YIM 98692]